MICCLRKLPSVPSVILLASAVLIVFPGHTGTRANAAKRWSQQKHQETTPQEAPQESKIDETTGTVTTPQEASLRPKVDQTTSQEASPESKIDETTPQTTPLEALARPKIDETTPQEASPESKIDETTPLEASPRPITTKRGNPNRRFTEGFYITVSVCGVCTLLGLAGAVAYARRKRKGTQYSLLPDADADDVSQFSLSRDLGHNGQYDMELQSLRRCKLLKEA